MKLTLPLRNLSDLDVKFVSLVNKGANQIAFRIVKSDDQESQMAGINLSTLWKKEELKPSTITGVVLAKNAPALLAEVQSILKAQGLSMPVTKSFDDGSAVVAVGDDYEQDSTLVRLNDQMAFVVKGFGPYAKQIDRLDAGQMTDRGFYDGATAAAQAMQAQVLKAIRKSEDVEAPAKMLKSYVAVLEKALPANAAEIEELVTKAAAAMNDGDPEDKVDGGADEATEGADGKKKDMKKAMPPGTKESNGDPGDGAAMEGATDSGAKTPDDETNKDQQAEGGDQPSMAVDGLKKSIEDLSALVKSLHAEVSTLKKSAQSTEAKIDEVSRKAEDAARVVKSTVVSSDQNTDPAPVRKVKKSDDPFTGVFDTGFMARRV